MSELVKTNCKVKVSVIIPTYNRPEMLADALRSILVQTYRNYEIIVINDGGVDIKGVVDTLNQGKRIIYLKNIVHSGHDVARNKGIKAARGKYIAYLDDDDIYYPNHLEILVNFLENSDFKVAYTDAYRANQGKRKGKYVVTNRYLEYSRDFDYDYILIGNFIPINCVMHEKTCFAEVGLFDESLKSHSDWDMWLRMSRRYKFAHLHQITCEYRRRQRSDHISHKMIGSNAQTFAYIYNKNKIFSQCRPDIIKQQCDQLDILNQASPTFITRICRRVFHILKYLTDRIKQL